MFVFDIVQISSGGCRFVVGVLHPPGYGSGVHRKNFCFLGGSYIMMDQFTLTFPRNLLKYPPEPNAATLKTRGSRSLNNIRIIFLCTVWEPNAHVMNLKVTRGFHDQVSDAAFQGRHCAYCCDRLANSHVCFKPVFSVATGLWYDIFSSSKNVLVMSNSSFADHCNAGWVTMKLMLSVSRLCLINCQTKHKMFVFDPKTASCNPKLVSRWMQTFLKLLLTPKHFFNCKFLDIFKHYGLNTVIQSVTILVF